MLFGLFFLVVFFFFGFVFHLFIWSVKKGTPIFVLSILFMYPLVRIFPREDTNLVFEKWHIMFIDASETPRPNNLSNEYSEWKIQGK